MSLSGSLTDLGLIHAMQTIGREQKIGVLRIIHNNEQADLYMSGHTIVASHAKGRGKADLFGELVVRAELIDRDTLNQALKRQQANAKSRIGENLVALKALTVLEVDAFATMQTSELVMRLLLWQSGSYSFIVRDHTGANTHTPLDSDVLIMESLRQGDFWPKLRRNIPSYTMRFKVVKSLEHFLASQMMQQPQVHSDLDNAFGLADDEATVSDHGPKSATIERRERIVFGLIDPDRDVQKLIDMGRLGEFETLSALNTLLELGLVASDKNSQQTRNASADVSVGGINSSSHAATVAWQWGPIGRAALVWMAIILTSLSGLPTHVTTQYGRALWVEASLRQLLWDGQKSAIEHALELYRVQHGVYPKHGSALVDDGLIAPWVWRGVWRDAPGLVIDDDGPKVLRPVF